MASVVVFSDKHDTQPAMQAKKVTLCPSLSFLVLEQERRVQKTRHSSLNLCQTTLLMGNIAWRCHYLWLVLPNHLFSCRCPLGNTAQKHSEILQTPSLWPSMLPPSLPRGRAGACMQDGAGFYTTLIRMCKFSIFLFGVPACSNFTVY